MQPTLRDQNHLPPSTHEFYRHVLSLLNQSGLPFLVGGAYVFERYTGIPRHTKDLDLFVRPDNCQGVLDKLAAAGYVTELTFPHWLGKARNGDDYIDVIFASGNSVCRVDDLWFEHAVAGEILGMPVWLCPAEETIWSKAFVMERERFDGADIAHLLRACAGRLSWPRIVRRFGSHWAVLLSHLILFRFIYPADRARIPSWVMEELLGHLQNELRQTPPSRWVCQGTLLTRSQYLPDIEQWGYQDARLFLDPPMSSEQVKIWTAPVVGEE